MERRPESMVVTVKIRKIRRMTLIIIPQSQDHVKVSWKEQSKVKFVGVEVQEYWIRGFHNRIKKQ